MSIRAVIWDFDGTILDTEWPAFYAAKVEYDRVGLELSFEGWSNTIGTANHRTWSDFLHEQAGDRIDSPELVETRYRTLKNEMTNNNPVMPGVESVFDQIAELGLGCALASSSPIEWVQRHTTRLGFWDRFQGVATRTDVGRERTKPHPDLFLLAAERADLDPQVCLVIEDSNHGVTAANAAGMTAVAVPNRLTVRHDFSHAAARFDSLEELDLNDWVG